jgi:hypothetical protein
MDRRVTFVPRDDMLDISQPLRDEVAAIQSQNTLPHSAKAIACQEVKYVL